MHRALKLERKTGKVKDRVKKISGLRQGGVFPDTQRHLQTHEVAKEATGRSRWETDGSAEMYGETAGIN